MKQRFRGTAILLLLTMAVMQTFAQPYDGKKQSKDSPPVTLRVEVTSPTTAAFVDLQKAADDKARLGTNQPGRIEVVRDGKVIISWDKNDSERVWKSYNKSYVPGSADQAKKEQDNKKKEQGETKQKNKEADNNAPTASVVPAEQLAPVSSETVISDFEDKMASDSYYATQAIQEFQDTIDEHINNLRGSADQDAYIAKNELDSYARAEREVLQQHRDEIEAMVTKFLNKYKKRGVNDREDCENQLMAMVNERLDQREEALSRLENELGITPPTAKTKSVKWIPIAICALGAILLVVLLTWLVKSRKKSVGPAPVMPRQNKSQNTTKTTGEPAIVVRRTTTAILKRQSLEDVVNSPAYLPIEVNEFCDAAAVRRIYLKNTCVKDIYEMYALDLRNSPNPNENGCMVLGRWVYDPQQQDYYVSLEEVVMPGDDAVFQEYELNFGGKIKLRANGRLRKLRTQTNLQYDLTCWVHSHPGLGVFFSNADTSVHHQLKHPTHPLFLTAIVVDILTKGQQLGIFVFRRDGSVCSKNDLKKMYSLEKLYQWAVNSCSKEQPTPVGSTGPKVQPQSAVPPMQPQSAVPPVQPRTTAPPVQPRPATPPAQPPLAQPSIPDTEYIDILSHAAARLTDCHSIMLNNHAVEQLRRLIGKADSGLVGFIHGTTTGSDDQQDCNVETMTSQPVEQQLRLLGCVVVSPHISLPTIRKTVAPFIGLLKFVMVYSPTNGTLTTIPVLRQDLCIDEHFYGEQKLDDLLSWINQ